MHIDPRDMRRRQPLIGAIAKWLLIAIAGYVVFIVPVLVAPLPRHMASVLFQMYSDAVYSAGWANLVLLFILGVGLGQFVSKRSGLTGCASVVLLPILAIIEMIKDPTSHNLFPFEFITYAFFGGIVLIGSLPGVRLRES